jgi:hypothetical protein
MINSRTLPLGPPLGVLVEGPRGVRFVGVQGGSQHRKCTTALSHAVGIIIRG